MDRFLVYLKEYYDELSITDKKQLDHLINERRIIVATMVIQQRLKCGLKTSKCIVDFWKELKENDI